MPNVSFILPAYKGRFLKESVSSILKQTYADFELIVVNDKSPDDVKEIVTSFNDNRIRYHENPENIGGKDLVGNWNRCMDYASGKWAIMASDDDVYNANFLEEMIRLTLRYPDTDLFHCRIKVINSDGGVIGFSEPCLEYECAEEFVYQNLIKRRRQVAPDFMFRLSAIRKIGGFVNFPLAWGSDDATWCKLAVTGNGVAYCGKILFSWRLSGENLSSLATNIEEKAKARILFNTYLKNEVFTLMDDSGELSSFFKRLVMSNADKAIKQELVDQIVNTKSLTTIKNVLKNKDIRLFLGRKEFFILLLRIIRVKIF